MTRRKPLPADETVGTKAGMIEAYCLLQGYVNEEVFRFSVASDCFCSENEGSGEPFWRSESDVYEFIHDAVMEKLARRKTYVVESRTVVVALNEDDALARHASLDQAGDVLFLATEVEE